MIAPALARLYYRGFINELVNDIAMKLGMKLINQ